MALEARYCGTVGANITVVTDLEGGVTNVFCPEYEAATGACRLKQRAYDGGPLAQLFARLSAHGLDTRSPACPLRAGSL